MLQGAIAVAVSAVLVVVVILVGFAVLAWFTGLGAVLPSARAQFIMTFWSYLLGEKRVNVALWMAIFIAIFVAAILPNIQRKQEEKEARARVRLQRST